LFWAGLRVLFKSHWCELTDNEKENYTLEQGSIDWVSGAWLMTRKDLWNDIGGLDESYFMYVEDVDYCKNIRNKGFRIGYTPKVEIIHFGGGGRAWVGNNALKNTADSYMYYLKKFYGPVTRFFTTFIIAMLWVIRASFYGLSYLFKRNQLSKEKMFGYFSTGLFMFRKLILRA